MTHDQARQDAQRVADRNGVAIALVHDPIANAEELGDYGFCPVAAVPVLFRHGTIVETIEPKELNQ